MSEYFSCLEDFVEWAKKKPSWRVRRAKYDVVEIPGCERAVLRSHTTVRYSVPHYIVKRDYDEMKYLIGPFGYAIQVCIPRAMSQGRDYQLRPNEILYQLSSSDRKYFRINSTNSEVAKEFERYLEEQYNVKFQLLSDMAHQPRDTYDEEFVDLSKEECKEVYSIVAEYEIQTYGRLSEFSERDIETKFVLRLLKALGWDIYHIDEVKEEEEMPEVAKGRRFDIILKSQGRNIAVVEVKPRRGLDDFVDDCLNNARKLYAQLAVVTSFKQMIIKDIKSNKEYRFNHREYVRREKFSELWRLLAKVFHK